jgi:hypothetical protein
MNRGWGGFDTPAAAHEARDARGVGGARGSVVGGVLTHHSSAAPRISLGCVQVCMCGGEGRQWCGVGGVGVRCVLRER